MIKQSDLHVEELDGHNCLGRTMSLGVKGAIVGALYGSAAAALTPPKPAPTPLILQALTIVKNSTLLVGGAASLFAGTTCAMAAIRGKDDYKNWAAGGAASGALIGISRKSWALGSGAAVALAAAAAAAKYTGAYKHPFREDRIYV
ncbi:outer envelope pore protein 16-4, chloroplastic [Nematostella vectensis]|uniref:outer envelope pore protein 16-4, chloroplastic n=1 Tax=Nematostella vectensis TaxID=45351 RepID=UPI0020774C03|nr:outer envelope pore protein 16-4, chloroplastic [Nematostella vectensis]